MVQIMVEETAGKKRPGATQVVGLTLINTQVSFGPSLTSGPSNAHEGGGGGSRDPMGASTALFTDASVDARSGGGKCKCMRAAVSVSDVRVHDLQSCVEHRNVLSGNAWRAASHMVNYHSESFCRPAAFTPVYICIYPHTSLSPYLFYPHTLNPFR